MVRVSGPQTEAVLAAVCRLTPAELPERRARLAPLIHDGRVIDHGLVTRFVGPRSYTGEHAAELCCHGNPLLVEQLIAACVAVGARVAHPGEFTRRAFLAGRIDLARAEAVLQTIEATSPRGLAVAQQGLDGAVGSLVDGLRADLTEALSELEARLDYPAEGLELEDDRALAARVVAVGERAAAAAATWQAGRVLVEGATVALVGPVNAGKSSLFNALGGSVRALVSDTPGTTRDVVERRVRLGSVSIRLLDTAGEREADGLEAAGIELGRSLTADADLLVVVVPSHDPDRARPLLERLDGPHLLVGNHADRPGARTSLAGRPLLPTVATTGEGLDALAAAIAEALVGEELGSGLVIASLRQRDLLGAVARACTASASALQGEPGPAVAAEELYGALARLDALIGRDTREAVLDSLFRRFCIGK